MGTERDTVILRPTMSYVRDWQCAPKARKKDAPPCLNFLTKKIPYKGLGAESVEKREPVCDIDTAAADSLKTLDPKRPIREATEEQTFQNRRTELQRRRKTSRSSEYASHSLTVLRFLFPARAHRVDRAQRSRDEYATVLATERVIRQNRRKVPSDKLANRAFVSKQLQRLGLNFEPLHVPGRPSGPGLGIEGTEID